MNRSDSEPSEGLSATSPSCGLVLVTMQTEKPQYPAVKIWNINILAYDLGVFLRRRLRQQLLQCVKINWTSEDHCVYLALQMRCLHINTPRRRLTAGRQNSARLQADCKEAQLVVEKNLSQKWFQNHFKTLSWLEKNLRHYLYKRHRRHEQIPPSWDDSDGNKGKRKNKASAFESPGWIMAREALLQNFVLTERKWTWK